MLELKGPLEALQSRSVMLQMGKTRSSEVKVLVKGRPWTLTGS